MDYEALLVESDGEGLIVKEKPLKYNDGRIKGNKIAIRNGIGTSAEKACVLAEELGHYHTSSGDIINTSNIQNRKQEMCARMWAYDRLVGLTGIIDCYKAGCQTISGMAEHLEVTEQFLKEALERYRQKYGVYTTVDNYIIYFEPRLVVAELLSDGIE